MKQKSFGGGLFRISENYLDAKDKSLIKNQVNEGEYEMLF